VCATDSTTCSPTSSAAFPDGAAETAGIAAGAAGATAMLEDRDGDGRYVPFSFIVGDVDAIAGEIEAFLG
jgi:hypothetical protein